jgi:hypothetical protein
MDDHGSRNGGRRVPVHGARQPGGELRLADAPDHRGPQLPDQVQGSQAGNGGARHRDHLEAGGRRGRSGCGGNRGRVEVEREDLRRDGRPDAHRVRGAPARRRAHCHTFPGRRDHVGPGCPHRVGVRVGLDRRADPGGAVFTGDRQVEDHLRPSQRPHHGAVGSVSWSDRLLPDADASYRKLLERGKLARRGGGGIPGPNVARQLPE